jgi:hypothetical protein
MPIKIFITLECEKLKKKTFFLFLKKIFKQDFYFLLSSEAPHSQAHLNKKRFKKQNIKIQISSTVSVDYSHRHLIK